MVSRVRQWLRKKQQFDKLLKIHDRYKTHTMMDLYLFADNLKLAQGVDHILGDVVKCGVWRGGMSAGLATVLTGNRHYYLFDSFEGMPAPTEQDGASAHAWFRGEMPHSYYDNCSADTSFAQAVMETTSKPFTLVKGWFNQTLPDFEIKAPIAILRLDADWYDSIKICLEKFYPAMARGGLVLLDDYYTWDGCSRAVHDFLSQRQSTARISKSNNGVAYFYKTPD